ncbi:MAG: flagellar hook assembly protein FlgD [Rhizobiales bacterium]|nr:flagellar hook assembly protein FlgD [Hyphomicrobiales bacterium]
MDFPSLAGVSGGSGSIADRQLIADNLDTFLQLLTTQLRNQDPLEPLDTNEFTSQLVQFSQVEQAVKSNELLEALAASQTGSASQTALGYIGKLVTADGATAIYDNGEANWALTANEDARATYTIRDANGAIIFTAEDLIESGTSVFTWDGTTSTGQIAPDGLYTLGVDARDGAGRSVKVSTEITGIVRGADFDTGEPMLDIGGLRVRLSQISAVSLPPNG